MVERLGKEMRIILSKEAAKDLSIMMEDLMGSPHIKVRPSKLVSWIVSRFSEQYLAREKQNLEKVFFDKKEFLRGLLSSKTSDAKIEELFKAANKKKSKKDSID